MEALKVEGLYKNFGGVSVLRDISFDVNVGERIAIIGPNGAGKTTLLSIINGQLLPTVGYVYFFGQNITHIPVYRRAHLGVARSFQRSNLFFNLTVLDNILLAIQGVKRQRFQMFRSINAYKEMFTEAEYLLESWDLWEKKNNLVSTICYGDQRKLEISLSLASKPKILLMDEPSNGLTFSETDSVIKKINNMEKNITVILVAHDMDLVFGIANRIIVIHYGKIITEGTPEEIQNNSKVKEIYLGIETDFSEC